MKTYRDTFNEQMAIWLKTKQGPMPVYSPEVSENTRAHRDDAFDLADAVIRMAKQQPGLFMAIYENWILKRQTKKIKIPKAELIEKETHTSP